MSVQFGRWNVDGRPLDPQYLDAVSQLTSKYAPDGEGVSFPTAGLAMLCRPFHTTKESTQEHQPLMNSLGVALTWDGRLDNRDELRRFLKLPERAARTDAELVLAAYERLNTKSFAELVGDWALAIWDPTKEALLLAKDFVGTRHLFYALEPHCVTWCTALDPLVLLAERSFDVSEEFIAGYLSTYPSTHLTPYAGINAVPASTFVYIDRLRTSTQKYWKFDPSDRIFYRTDAEYEEHFRHVFTQSIRRRLRSSSPVIAELSGGMDSSSVVCVADAILAEGGVDCPQLDTISYYADSEPNWNERPYFSLVEKKRGREGYHINVGGTEGAFLPVDSLLFFPLPGYDYLALTRCREFSRCLQASHSRVVLSGIGGDEFLGGVPTPIPELQNLLVQGRWIRFIQQLYKWSLQKRCPWAHLCLETLEEFLPQPVRNLYTNPVIAPWLARDFVRRNHHAFREGAHRTGLTGPRPSFQTNLNALNHLRRQLHFSHLSNVSNHRISFPYLDRNLLSFLFAIPREQLVRPHQRRSLMRRALAGIVPAEIIERKRKAFVTRQPFVAIQTGLPRIESLLQSSLTVSYGWTDPAPLSEIVKASKHGQLQHLGLLHALLKLELWLRSLIDRNVLSTFVSRDHNTLANGAWHSTEATEFISWKEKVSAQKG
jgi:asparagine synthase (glutamine-hydrolysing)